MFKNRKVFILLVTIVALLSINYKPSPQTVVPSCFTQEDCRIAIPEGYCDSTYNCIVGKCTSQLIRCPETCYGLKDDDYDKLTDCKDPDCFNSPYCPCQIKSYNECVYGKCYCPENSVPLWYVFEEGHQCICA